MQERLELIEEKLAHLEDQLLQFVDIIPLVNEKLDALLRSSYESDSKCNTQKLEGIKFEMQLGAVMNRISNLELGYRLFSTETRGRLNRLEHKASREINGAREQPTQVY